MDAKWKIVHEIKGNHDTVLRVQRLGDRRPRYSLQWGRLPKEPGEMNDQGFPKISPFIPVFIEAQGTVSVDRDSERMLKSALDWIHEDAMQFEKSYVEAMIQRDEERDEKSGNRKQNFRQTGKTERDRNKKRNGHARAD